MIRLKEFNKPFLMIDMEYVLDGYRKYKEAKERNIVIDKSELVMKWTDLSKAVNQVINSYTIISRAKSPVKLILSSFDKEILLPMFHFKHRYFDKLNITFEEESIEQLFLNTEKQFYRYRKNYISEEDENGDFLLSASLLSSSYPSMSSSRYNSIYNYDPDELLERHNIDTKDQEINYGNLDLNQTQLCYLTPDSDNVLTELDKNTIYIIGAIADKRNKAKNLTLEKAKKLNLEHARLPLVEHYPDIIEHAFLNVNHVFDILTKYIDTNDWKYAIESTDLSKRVKRIYQHK